MSIKKTKLQFSDSDWEILKKEEKNSPFIKSLIRKAKKLGFNPREVINEMYEALRSSYEEKIKSEKEFSKLSDKADKTFLEKLDKLLNKKY